MLHKGTEKKISLMLYFSPPGQVFKKTVNKQNKIGPADTESIQFTLTLYHTSNPKGKFDSINIDIPITHRRYPI